MTKSKNLVLITIFLCFSFLLTGLCFVGCDKKQLATPQIVYENGTIKWEPVKNAEKYEVKINEQSFITYNRLCEIPLTDSSTVYNVTVKSIGKSNNDSKFCKPLIFTARKFQQPPVIISIDNNWDTSRGLVRNQIKWMALVVGSKEILKYNISINNKFYKSVTYAEGNYSKACTLTIESSAFKTGENTISVEPVVEKSIYDIIIPYEITVEKSEPLPNIENYRIIDGQIYYGFNYEYIYDTSQLGDSPRSITLWNLEKDKIASDGPNIEVHRSMKPTKAPTIKSYTDKYFIEYVKEKDNEYDFVKITLISKTNEILYTHIIEMPTGCSSFNFYVDKNIFISDPYWFKVSVWKKDNIESRSNTFLAFLN